jgi:hypothetical protein
MLPAGYMAKRVAARPDWLRAPAVTRVHSLSGCVSQDFADYVGFWKHNGYWLFDSPQAIVEVARENQIALTGTELFYYEVHEQQFDGTAWTPVAPESWETRVIVPSGTVLHGFDVATFNAGSRAECSPLSCNGLAADVATNEYCLLDSLEAARTVLQNGTFEHAEPGPYRIFAVYSVAWPAAEKNFIGGL